MNQQSFQRIDAFLASSTQELFKSHGIPVASSPHRGRDAENTLTATIGFTSDNLRGLLVLTLDRDLAARSLPDNLRQGVLGDAIVADWTGELSNQLLGRLKNKFHSVSIDISLSTPIVFIGKEMRHFVNESPIQRTIFFAEGGMLVEIQANYDRDFEISEAGEALEPGQPEGEALFF